MDGPSPPSQPDHPTDGHDPNIHLSNRQHPNRILTAPPSQPPASHSSSSSSQPNTNFIAGKKPSMSYFRMSRRTAEPDFAEDSETFTDPLLEDDLESTMLVARNRQLPHENPSSTTTTTTVSTNTIQQHGRLGCIRYTTSWLIRTIGNLLAAMTFLAMLIGIPWVTYHALQNNRFDLAAVDSAAVMVLGTVILSTRLVYLHLTHWYMPDVQKYVVRILWMVPLYAVQSWLSLRFHTVRLYIDAVRDLYEAYVIASFLYYLIELLGGQDALVQMLQAKQVHQEQQHHLGQHGFPLNLVLQPWEMGMEFLLQCKHGVLQYVVLKSVATFITFACESLGLYGEGQFEWDRAYPYLSFILNISVMYALYCLVKLFHAVNEELRYPRDWHPLGKFLAVKGVVFFTWWQGIIIFYLRAHGIIHNVGSWTGDDVANGLIDYCICIEMVLFAICHYYVFTWKEYLPNSQQQPSLSQHQQQHQQQHSALHHHPQLDDVVVDENDLESLLLSRYQPKEDAAGSAASSTTDDNSTKPMYRPPTVLSHPMKFRDALWNSTVPQETLHDLRRLRKGVDTVIQQTQAPGAIGLVDMTTSTTTTTTTTTTTLSSASPPPPPPTFLSSSSTFVNPVSHNNDNIQPNESPKPPVVNEDESSHQT